MKNNNLKKKTFLTRGTVAQDYANFWVDINSTPVQVVGQGENVPAGISTTRQPQTSTTPRFVPRQTTAVSLFSYYFLFYLNH